MCAGVWVHIGANAPHKSDFLGTLISISNHSLEHCLKGRLLINSMVKNPSPDPRTETPSLLHFYCCSSFLDLHTISSRTKSGWFESDGLLQEEKILSVVYFCFHFSQLKNSEVKQTKK